MIIHDIIRLRNHIDAVKNKKTPYRKYLDEMQKVLTRYSLENSNTALDRTYEFMLTHQLNDTSIAQIPYIVSDIFLKDKQGLKAIKDKLQELTGPLYFYEKPVMKLSDDEIMAIDQETIKMLTEAEMLWILDYANNVQIARDITRIMTDSKAAGLDMTETAKALNAELSSYTPSEFAKRFGEEKYWKLVNHNATFRTKSYATINQLDYAGVKQYQWITRGAEACPICVPYDQKIFTVSDAKGRMNAYFDAAKEGSVINMQKADPFLDLDEALLNPDGIMGMMPPIHHWCYCEIVIYYTEV